MSQTYIDWDVARKTGHRIASDGPKTSVANARVVVEELRSAAERAHQPVADTARLNPGSTQTPVHVVDRTTWIDVNAGSMGALVQPAVERITAQRLAGPRVRAVGAKIAGAEVGALLGYVSSKVLGQFDLAPEGQPSLMLVAPNIVKVERELGVDPHDFRLWVCLHEETHRVQFTAVPWLREHVITSARELMIDLVPDPEQLPERMQQVVARLPEVVRGGGGGLTDLFTTPEQRAEVAKVTAVMSLLEGHADVVMDEVGPQIVPSVADIRKKFDARRAGGFGPDRLLRRLLGLEAKMRQYRDGAIFVRTVIDQVGLDGFNTVWTSPETLPLPTEIADPPAWVARVHG
ncbi:zinc-dependent metalloprotease [Demetria terragena]|uniref:zinc-dependent metalloprotease n=1 Tax=Demetria terragena TaxID=63959 RepID=UPI00035F21EB|nr:zinc-dependent metalloprotease [Demetria terragena]